MYRYQIKKGAENREFANCRRVSDTIVESDQELHSSYLELINDAPVEQTQMTATPDPAPAPQAAAAPVAQAVAPVANQEASA